MSGGDDGRILVWEITTGGLIRKMSSTAQVYAVLFSENGQRAFSAGADRVVRYWNLVSAQQAGSAFTGHAAAIYGLALSPDGQQLLTASQDLSVRL